jgi:hypothetical protein
VPSTCEDTGLSGYEENSEATGAEQAQMQEVVRFDAVQVMAQPAEG